VTSEEQLSRWVAGVPTHNSERDECCPDFSCCYPPLLASRSVRERYAAAVERGDERERESMAGLFLGAALTIVTGPEL
jgi:hypothetical protein